MAVFLKAVTVITRGRRNGFLGRWTVHRISTPSAAARC